MIKISKLTDYATVILACLATKQERLYTATEIATMTRIGTATVSKLLKKLHRGGLLNSNRGSRGGYQLARPAKDISAAEILAALEGPLALTECSGAHSHCDIFRTCGVGHAWQRVNVAIYRALQDISLAQLAGLEQIGNQNNLVRVTSTAVPLTRMVRPK